MRQATTSQGYTALAIVLHWAIAAAIVANFVLGLWMHEAIDVEATRACAVVVFQLHKSIGLTVLALSLLRLAWRLAHRPPPLPAHMPSWERWAAHATHWLFYALMLAIPLSGWLYASTHWRGDAPLAVPTIWFGLFQVPDLFGLGAAAEATRNALADTFLDSHELLAWSAVVLLVLHIGAALKHQFVDRDEVAGHMIPALAPAAAHTAASPGHRLVLWIGFAGIAAAIAALCWAVLRPLQPASAVSPGKAATVSVDRDIGAATGGWLLDPAQSHIRFSGDNAGTPFSGHFTHWNVDLDIDAENPMQSRVHATIWTASATDGIKMHEEALPTAEWFDVTRYPTAKYAAIRVTPRDDGSYRVEGELTIKDNTHAVGPLQLRIADGIATISGRVVLHRDAFDLGMESDPNGEWVSNDITVDVQVVANQP